MSLWARTPCAACGEPVSPDEGRCPACGAPQGPEEGPDGREWGAPESPRRPRADPPPPAYRPQTPSDVSPGGRRDPAGPAPAPAPAPAADGGGAPGLLEASLAAATVSVLTAFGMFLVIVIAAIVITALPFDHSIVQFHGSGLGFARRTLLAAGQLVQAPFDASSPELGIGTSVQATPILSLILPIGTAAILTRIQAGALAGLPPAARLACGAAAGVPFTVLMVLLAALSRTTITVRQFSETFETAPDTAFALSLLWGAIGGLIGVWSSLTAQERDRLRPPAVLRAAGTHLAVALAVSGVLMTAVVLVQTARDSGGSQSGRGALGAIVENATFAGEHAVHGLQLGMLGQFRSPEGERVFLAPSEIGLVVPVPTAKFQRLLAERKYRLPAFKDALPGGVYLLALLLLMGIPAILCVRAGWACARAAGGTTVAANIAAGAVVGPVWAVAITLLAALADKSDADPYWGLSDLTGTFLPVLFFGGLLGALGAAAIKPDGPAPAGTGPAGTATS